MVAIVVNWCNYVINKAHTPTFNRVLGDNFDDRKKTIVYSLPICITTTTKKSTKKGGQAVMSLTIKSIN